MIKNRRHGHLGLPTNNIDATVNWYKEVLGFEEIGSFKSPAGEPVKFIRNADIVYEIYQPADGVAETVAGKIDHYSFASDDIEADYAYCKGQGYQITTNGIEAIPTFWEHGVRYFKIASPTGEELEFCQVL